MESADNEAKDDAHHMESTNSEAKDDADHVESTNGEAKDDAHHVERADSEAKDDAHHVERADGEAKEGDGGAKHPLHVAPVPPEPRVQQPAPPRVRPLARTTLLACPSARAVTARVQGRLLSAAEARGPCWTRHSTFLLFVALLPGFPLGRTAGASDEGEGPHVAAYSSSRECSPLRTSSEFRRPMRSNSEGKTSDSMTVKAPPPKDMREKTSPRRLWK